MTVLTKLTAPHECHYFQYITGFNDGIVMRITRLDLMIDFNRSGTRVEA